MFFCCYSNKDPLDCRNQNDELSEVSFTSFDVCPQLFFSHFLKLFYFRYFMAFKNNFNERNSKKNIKKNKKQLRIQNEIKLLQIIQNEHNKNSHLFLS